MASEETNRAAGSALGFFLRAVGYPEQPSVGVVSFVLSVDGMEIRAEEADGRIVLIYILAESEAFLPRFAEYASGRMLKEDAVLSFGQPGVSASERPAAVFLWQDAPTNSDVQTFRRLFEMFLDSCEWWRARADALRGGSEAAAESDTMVIRP